MIGLQGQALFQRACRHARRVELLDLVQHLLDELEGLVGLLGDLVERLIEVTVGREVAEDEESHRLFLVGEVTELELPLEVGKE
jgi:hypothetical protein